MDVNFWKFFLPEVTLESNVVETFVLFEAFEPSPKHAFSKGFSPQGSTTSKNMDAGFWNFFLHEVILESNFVDIFVLFEALETSPKHVFSKGFSPQGWTTTKNMDACFWNFPSMFFLHEVTLEEN